MEIDLELVTLVLWFMVTRLRGYDKELKDTWDNRFRGYDEEMKRTRDTRCRSIAES